MSFLKRRAFPHGIAGLATVLFSALLARANCGLDYCPRDRDHAEGANHVSVGLRNYAFDLPGGSGSYQEALFHYEYTGVSSLALGASLPVERLSVGSDSRTGISNPLVSATWYRHLASLQMIYAGVQLELPWGDHDHGMAANHYMLVPYAQWEGSFPWGALQATVGLSNAFGGHEADSTAVPLYVHPHEDRELLYRVGYGPRLASETFRPRVFVSGQYALVDENENGPGKSHLSAGLALEIRLRPGWSVEPIVEFPIETPARFDWSAGAGLRADL